MSRSSGRWSAMLVVGALGVLATACANDATAPDARPAVFTAPSPIGSGSQNCMRTATGGSVCSTAQGPSGDWQLVTVGTDHTCALKTSGAAYCWGSNRDGQLGIVGGATACGTSASPYPCAMTPIEVQRGVHFASISAGARHTCGITTAGEPTCWGANDNGQVGSVGVGHKSSMRSANGVGFIQISAGFSHSCAVRGDGAVFCWGANARGQLGDGSLVDQSVPVLVSLPAAAASVSAGQDRTCARTTANVVYCWGAVWTARESGWEMTRFQPVPAPVPNAPALGTLSVGTFTTCGADAHGSAYCWEANPRGEMGNGTQDGSVTPLRVAASAALSDVSAGMVQSCGLAADGTGYCWGDNTFGELGVSPSSLVERCDRQGVACSTVPVEVSGGQHFVQLSTGLGSHTCGVTTSGNVACWGLGVSGQRGDGSTTYVAYLPTLVGAGTSP